MRTTAKIVLVLLTLGTTSLASMAQTLPLHPSTPDGKPGMQSAGKMPFRDEKGKELTMQQVQALSATGNYQISKATDKDHKTYILVKKVPAVAPKPVSKPKANKIKTK